MEGMRNIMILLSKTMPEEYLIDKMQEALKEYNLTKSKEAKHELHFNTTLWLLKISTDGENAFDVMKKLEEAEKASQLFSIHKDKLS